MKHNNFYKFFIFSIIVFCTIFLSNSSCLAFGPSDTPINKEFDINSF